jgi:hypothetical protein
MPRTGWGEKGLERAEALLEILLSHEKYPEIQAHWYIEPPDIQVLKVTHTTKKALAEIITGGKPIYAPEKLATQKRYIQESFKQLTALGLWQEDRTTTRGPAAENLRFSLRFRSRQPQQILEQLRQQWWNHQSKRDPTVDPPIVAPDLELTNPPVKSPTRHQNLPPRNSPRFVGRESEFSQLLQWLYTDNAPAHLSIEGLGGVGKTTLVLEVAYRCLQDGTTSPFDAFIFTSAQQDYFTPRGVVPRPQQQRTLAQILRTVAIVLDCPGILKEELDTQIDQLYLHLSRQRVLLIVDNLDGIEQQQEIVSFLYGLPGTVKVVMTSREQAITDLVIRLGPLSPDESLTLITRQAKAKIVSLGPGEAQTLAMKTGECPLPLSMPSVN